MRYSLLLALAGIISAAAAGVPDAAGESAAITILYSGDTYGTLESCG